MMADLAMVFHWPPGEMREMELSELVEWHERAGKRASSHRRRG